MKNRLITFIAILTIFILSSCEDVIQVKLDKGTPIVTIDAFINDMRKNQKVRLTFTDAYFSKEKNAPVIGATVKIKDLTSGASFNFLDNNNGDYILTILPGDTIGRVNHNYELTVLYKGTTYSSTTKLNRTSQVDSIDVKFQEAGSFGREEGYKCTFLGFDEPGDEPDFYWVKSFRDGVGFDTKFFNTAYNGAYGDEADGFPFIVPIAEGITPGGEVYLKNQVCRVEIHSINLITYNMLFQVQQQITNSGLFATTPENVKTNIITNDEKIKVVGWFCMSAVGVKEKIVK